MLEKDRRRFQRMKLARPILGALDGESALILDIGLGGAFVEHHGQRKVGDLVTLSFRWHGEEITFRSEVARTRMTGDNVAQSGVNFVEMRGASVARLQDMMATFVGRVLAAQKANASADVEESGAILYQLGDARKSRSRGYMAYLWDGKSWTCRPTQMADQPRSGFTLAAYEDEDEVETLCRTFETADEEGRRLIRLVAELSANTVKK